MSVEQPNNPLHGVTLEMILSHLVAQYGWEELGRRITIKCFIDDPSIKSSLKFLRRTPWARKKVEDLYLSSLSKAGWNSVLYENAGQHFKARRFLLNFKVFKWNCLHRSFPAQHLLSLHSSRCSVSYCLCRFHSSRNTTQNGTRFYWSVRWRSSWLFSGSVLIVFHLCIQM